MRTRFHFSLTILLVMMLLGLLLQPVIGASAPPPPICDYSQLIRLHVVANSNSPEDQRLKEQVRDAILKEFGPQFKAIEQREQAQQVLLSSFKRIEEIARTEIQRAGGQIKESYGVRVEYGCYQFPEKTYSFATLPAGRYWALRVTLGKGIGNNWWCVLYPPLCFVSEEEDAQARAAAANGEKIEWRFAFLENVLAKCGLLLNQFWKAWGEFFGLGE